MTIPAKNPANMPTAYYRVEKAIRLLVDIAPGKLSLDELAATVHLSSFQFQREFSAWAGVSPAQFSRLLSRQYLQSRLRAPGSLQEVADEAGLSSTSRLHDLFVTLDAVTPQEYRTGGAGIEILWGVHPSILGDCMVGLSERGVCNLEFLPASKDGISSNELAKKLLQDHWPAATLIHDEARTVSLADRLTTLIGVNNDRAGDPRSPRSQKPLSCLVKGTNFQLKIWQALLKVPAGQPCSYKQLATQAGAASSHRAVANALAANPVAYFIPCHRVIKSDGLLGGYHWQAERKAALLAMESRDAI